MCIDFASAIVSNDGPPIYEKTPLGLLTLAFLASSQKNLIQGTKRLYGFLLYHVSFVGIWEGYCVEQDNED